MSHPEHELFIENLYALIGQHLNESEYDEAEELMRVGARHGIRFPSQFWKELNLAETKPPQNA